MFPETSGHPSHQGLSMQINVLFPTLFVKIGVFNLEIRRREVFSNNKMGDFSTHFINFSLEKKIIQL